MIVANLSILKSLGVIGSQAIFIRLNERKCLLRYSQQRGLQESRREGFLQRKGLYFEGNRALNMRTCLALRRLPAW